MALKFHAILQISKMIGEEYKEMYPSQYAKDTQAKIALREGFKGFNSDSADCIVEHCTHYPVTIVLFYDADIHLQSIYRSLAVKILDVFLFKFEMRLIENDYRNFTPQNSNYQQYHIDEAKREFDFTDNPGTTFESSLPIIFEDTLIEYIKQLYVRFSTFNMQVPWIYLIQNKDILT